LKTYDNAVYQMGKLLRERHVCLHSRKAHERCYSELRDYLITSNLNFSLENARDWLKEGVKAQISKNEFQARWHYVDQLDELIRTGTVLQDHLLLTKPNYEKLSEFWKVELDDYLKNRESDYSAKSFALAKLRCSGFLLKLQENAIYFAKEISSESICNFYELEIPITKSERYVILSNARQFLQHQVLIGKCEPFLPLLLEEDIYRYSANKEIFNPDVISNISDTVTEISICSARHVFDSIDLFIQEFEKNGYKETVKHNVSHILKCLYVFLAINKMDYSPSLAKRWYEQIEHETGQSYRTWIRVLNLYERFIQNNEFLLSQKYSFQSSRTAMYPMWCAESVEGYLNWLKRSFHSDETIRTYKYSVYHFCDYLLNVGMDCFDNLEKSLILDYLNHDQHATVKGTSTRRTVLRQFVTYLEDNNLVNDKTLHHVFPNKVAGTTRIVTILSSDQMSGIDMFRQECSSAIDLRDAAMVMIGLRLGFRSSDVINLKLADIDWLHKEVSIIQYKTKVPIALPLRTDVGNAIFRYIKYGRPSSDSEYVFIRHKAPYGKLSGKICSNALNRILHLRGFESSVAFHTLRKTFATNILKNNAGIERVVDALGHQDQTTVNKYLTFDEEHMRKCPLSLSNLTIKMGGVS
jgi:site-specific recombinase XerD